MCVCVSIRATSCQPSRTHSLRICQLHTYITIHSSAPICIYNIMYIYTCIYIAGLSLDDIEVPSKLRIRMHRDVAHFTESLITCCSKSTKETRSTDAYVRIWANLHIGEFKGESPDSKTSASQYVLNVCICVSLYM